MTRAQLQTHWRVFWKFRQIHLIRLFEHRGDFFFWSIVAVMWSIFNFFFFDLIFQVTGSVAGWSRYELYVLLSTFTMLDAFTWSLLYYNMQAYTQMVFNGELNQFLVKPIDSQFLLMTQHNSYNNIFRLGIGAALLVWSLQKLQYQPTLLQVIAYIISLLTALFFLYSLWFIFSTFSFYTEKLDNINEIFPAMRRVWQVPRSIYTGIFSFIFTVILPVGLITSIPTELLIGKSSYWWLLYFILLSLGTFLFSRWFFKFSITRYVGQGN